MIANRKKVQDFIISNISKLTPGSDNPKHYEELFTAMSDEDFDAFIMDLESGDKFLTIIEPNFKSTVTVENNLKLADDLGYKFFQKVWFGETDHRPGYLSPVENMVVDLPVRRTSQTLSKKISVPDNNKVVDSLTGQPTGSSKGASISYPELQVCAAMELEDSMVELMKYRGGDVKGRRAYEERLSTVGKVDLDTLSQSASGVESTFTLKTFLTSAHLNNNLI